MAFLLHDATSVSANSSTVTSPLKTTVNPDKIIRKLRASEYPNQVWYFIASFIALVSLCHLVSVLHRLSTRGPSTRRGPLSLRRLPRALVNLFRVVVFRWTISLGPHYSLNATEVFLPMAYFAAVFTWTLINTTNTLGVRFDPEYWANRAGTIAAAQFSLLTALGMKNNIISALTGVSFEKLNYLHRASARVVCVLLWVHIAGRIGLGLEGDTSLARAYIRCGVLAITSLTVLSIVSIRPIRGLSYEVFIITHFVLGFIFLLGAYFHAQENLFGMYIWPSVLLWALDRFLRLVRIGIFKFSGSSKLHVTATVEVLSPHCLRVTLPRPKLFHWRPGQNANLTIPSVSNLPFEAHPFTISTIDRPLVERTVADEEKASSSSNEDLKETRFGKDLVFLLRVHRGFTQKLMNAVSGTGSPTFNAYVDGPYGSPPYLRGYNTVVLVAGGSGITFALPLLLEVIRRGKAGSSQCSKLVLIWAIRESEHIQWVSEALTDALRDVPSVLDVEIRIFVTGRGAQAWDDDSLHKEDAEDKSGTNTLDAKVLDSPYAKLDQGRPDLRALLDNVIEESAGLMSVNVCGPLALSDAVRAALRPIRFMDTLRGGPSVNLHVETFGI